MNSPGFAQFLRRLMLVSSIAFAAIAVMSSDARASCSDGEQNGTETGVDCGGACLACNGASCTANNQCQSGSCVDNVCTTVWAIATSQGTTAAQPGAQSYVIDPTLTVSGSSSLDGARVLVASGFQSSQDLLGFVNANGISGSYNSSIGVLTLTGTGTVAAYQAALRTVTYRNTNAASPNTADRVITFSLGAGGVGLEATNHFYEFVTVTNNSLKPWEISKTAAEARRYFGLKGYLATVTSPAENAFIAAKLVGEGWFGANDNVSEGTWRWVTGPEGLENGGQGRHFWTGLGASGGAATNTYRIGSTTDMTCTQASQCESGNCSGGFCKSYQNWASGEPNNCCGSENFGHFFASGLWNDYYTSNTSIAGYVVEYGGMPTDPPLILADNKTVRIVSVSCSNGTKDGSETDTDCGGSCGACATGKGCASGNDCQSFICTNLVCAAPACPDGVQNGSETDLDCGGSCALDCANGDSCVVNGDCQSGKCTAGVCQVPSCTDSVKNNGETDIDCGGPSCGDCADGNACLGSGDCVSTICAGNICQPAGCIDGARNGQETDIDCGGPLCGACDPTEACALPRDCTSRVCTGLVCQAPTCADATRNGGETGTDCGGPTSCNDCPAGQGCGSGADCLTGVCSNSICQAASCNDGVKNGGETGIDCGGSCPGDCSVGQGCNGAADCIEGVCANNVCAGPTCGDNVDNGNETDVDCGGSCGATCATNELCLVPGDCVDGRCVGNHCAAPSCSDSVKNGSETGLDCGGSSCPDCANGQGCLVSGDCISTNCIDNICTSGTCSDGIKNQNESDDDCGGVCPDCGYGDTCNGNGDCETALCVTGNCGCPDGEHIGQDGTSCIAPGECDGVTICAENTALTFYGVVSNAPGQIVGSIRCTRSALGVVTCDNNDGELIVNPIPWCEL